MAELEEGSHGKLYQLRKREYETKMRILRDMVMKKILETEAKDKKTNTQILIDSYVESNFNPPTEEELRSFYKNNEDRMNKPFSAVKDEIFEQKALYKKQELKQRYLDELAKRYELKFKIEAPLSPVVDIDVTGEPFWGKKDAKVVVVEYSDFECPYCQRMQPDVRRIRNEYENKIKWVFKDFPLSFHRQALKAHIAANCADQQNRYFDFQYEVFDAKSDIAPPQLISIGEKVGLNMDEFKACIRDPNDKISEEISEDVKTGVQAGVGGTPTIFVNGKVASNFRTYEGMKKTLDYELIQSGGS